MLNRLFHITSSLRLTVALFACAIVLVFWGTLAQVTLGLYRAQDEFFRSFFIYWTVPGSTFRLPIFPGGYLVGGLLLINLFMAHFRYYQPGKRKWGIVLIHLGIVLLLCGQLLTDALSSESLLHLRHGETKNYSESATEFELVLIDTTAPDRDKVIAIPSHRLAKHKDIVHPELPFIVRPLTFYPNSSLSETAADGHTKIETTAGIGSGIWWRALPLETEMDKRDMPSGIVELIPPSGSVGTVLVSSYLIRPQEFRFDGREYQIALRRERYYKPFSIHLLEFKHDKYPGTDIPKNFSSRVRLQRPESGEDREVLIYMNNPLRYEGETYYQASFDRDNQGTVLQVVRNPSWLTPYFSCVLVGIGLLMQFTKHLVAFAGKRKSA